MTGFGISGQFRFLVSSGSEYSCEGLFAVRAFSGLFGDKRQSLRVLELHMVLLGRLVEGSPFEEGLNSFLAFIRFGLGDHAFFLNVAEGRFFAIGFRSLILDLNR
jgi:hypothetical protein